MCVKYNFLHYFTLHAKIVFFFIYRRAISKHLLRQTLGALTQNFQHTKNATWDMDYSCKLTCTLQTGKIPHKIAILHVKTTQTLPVQHKQYELFTLFSTSFTP